MQDFKVNIGSLFNKLSKARDKKLDLYEVIYTKNCEIKTLGNKYAKFAAVSRHKTQKHLVKIVVDLVTSGIFVGSFNENMNSTSLLNMLSFFQKKTLHDEFFNVQSIDVNFFGIAMILMLSHYFQNFYARVIHCIQDLVIDIFICHSIKMLS